MKTFRMGGVHPKDNKFSAGQKIQDALLPRQVAILLSQNIGAPSTPVVAVGDLVKAGQLIGRSAGFVSANVHSSVSGKVIKIDETVDASGYKVPAVFIDVEGDEWLETIDRTSTLIKECTLEPSEILEKIATAG
ncbi:MAG TPA: hypothetical protein VK152_04560, partial [Paludibacter sp.]|nr:hypothetical protein [Paludibacter sp.]